MAEFAIQYRRTGYYASSFFLMAQAFFNLMEPSCLSIHEPIAKQLYLNIESLGRVVFAKLMAGMEN